MHKLKHRNNNIVLYLLHSQTKLRLLDVAWYLN